MVRGSQKCTRLIDASVEKTKYSRIEENGRNAGSGRTAANVIFIRRNIGNRDILCFKDCVSSFFTLIWSGVGNYFASNKAWISLNTIKQQIPTSLTVLPITVSAQCFTATKRKLRRRRANIWHSSRQHRAERLKQEKTFWWMLTKTKCCVRHSLSVWRNSEKAEEKSWQNKIRRAKSRRKKWSKGWYLFKQE